MIVLFTDFGLAGPYTGQIKAVLHREAPQLAVIDLFADAPSRNPKSSAYLLAAYAEEFPPGAVFLCVVDPGVGGGRAAAVVHAGGRWYVGPENGLFELVIRRSRTPPRWWNVTWRPDRLTPTFHGRDLFAPVAARLARDGEPSGREHEVAEIRRSDWPNELAEVVYIDTYGNAITGVRAAAVSPDADIRIGGRRIAHARTFSDVPEGTPMWYENSSGLLEIAVNMGRANAKLGLALGTPIDIIGLGRH